jgi:hypothetical protein
MCEHGFSLQEGKRNRVRPFPVPSAPACTPSRSTHETKHILNLPPSPIHTTPKRTAGRPPRAPRRRPRPRAASARAPLPRGPTAAGAGATCDTITHTAAPPSPAQRPVCVYIGFGCVTGRCLRSERSLIGAKASPSPPNRAPQHPPTRHDNTKTQTHRGERGELDGGHFIN